MDLPDFIFGLIVALGGAGGVVQVVKAIRSWRDGVRQRDLDADDRAIARLERYVERLESARDADTVYLGILITALASAGLPVPPRPV